MAMTMLRDSIGVMQPSGDTRHFPAQFVGGDVSYQDETPWTMPGLKHESGRISNASFQKVSMPSGDCSRLLPPQQNHLGNRLEEIRSAFGLTMVELAQICLAPNEATLRSWVKGEINPGETTRRRLFDLLIAARNWQSSGFSSYSHSLKDHVIDDQSVFDLLKQTEIDRDLIHFAGTRLSLRSPARKIPQVFPDEAT